MKGKISHSVSDIKKVIHPILRCNAVDGLSYVVTQSGDRRKVTYIACTNCTLQDKIPTLTKIRTEDKEEIIQIDWLIMIDNTMNIQNTLFNKGTYFKKN